MVAFLWKIAQKLYLFYRENPGTCTTALLAVYGYWGSWFSAFTASLPDPDNPADWNADGSWRRYKLVFKTVKQYNNQKPQAIPVAPIHTQEMLPPKP